MEATEQLQEKATIHPSTREPASATLELTQGPVWPESHARPRITLASGLRQARPEREASLQTSLPHFSANTVVGGVGRRPCARYIPGEAMEKEDMAFLLEAHHVGLGCGNSCGF